MNILEARRRLLEGGVKKRTAEGNPIVVRSLARMYPGLNIYGWSKQDGTPTPDNPVPIVSAGDEGEINVTVQGGNLLDESSIRNFGSSTDKPSDTTFLEGEKVNSHRIGARLDKNAILTGKYASVYFKVKTNKSIPFDMIGQLWAERKDGGNSVFGASPILFQENNIISGVLPISNNLIDAKNNISNLNVQFRPNNSPTSTVDNVSFSEFIVALVDIPYEPYKQPQTLTVQTPGGLPGIPVTSGGNYTDESGQQWVCDEIDLARGKYVQRVYKCVIDDSSVISSTIIREHNRFSISGVPVPISSGIGYCDHFGVSNIPINLNNVDEQISCHTDGRVYLRYDACATVNDLTIWLADNPVVYYYPLATPIETDLPAEEIAAYKAMHTYSPTTTVSNDAAAWMKVGYKTKKSLEVTT